MALTSIDDAQRKAARVAGASFLLAIAIVVIANYGVSFRLIVPGNAAATARNILAHETLFRLNIAANLLYAAVVVVLLAALYVVLKPVQRHLALVATSFRLVVAVMWGVAALNTLGALRLLGDAAYLSAFTTDQLQAMTTLHLTTSYDAYYIGLPFWGLASLVCSILWFRSRLIPRALAAFGVVTSAWCAISAIAFIAIPHFSSIVGASWYDLPILLFELALGLWLVFKGLP